MALAIGFLVGIERGWKQRDEQDGERVAGLRTFALSGLFGGLTGLTLPLAGPLFLAAVSLAFAALFILFQYLDAIETGTKSATAALVGLMVYGLGVYSALGDLTVAAAVGVTVTLILAFKQTLHGWLKSLSWPEIRSALLILAATFIALPILPDRTIDPWEAVNPRSLWFMTIVLAAATFGGYVALKVLGQKAGLFVGAVVGAIVSSTAVTLDLARRAKAGEAPPRDAAAAAMLATVVSLTRVGIIGSAFSAGIALHLWIPLGAAILVSLAFAATIVLIDRGATSESGERNIRNPLDVVEVGKFALLLAVLTVAAKLSAVWFGDAGLSVFAATAGLVDVDAVTLAVGGMRNLSPTSAASAILIAAAANTLFKAGIAVATGGRAFGLWFGAACVAALAAGAIAFAVSAAWVGEPGAGGGLP
ncbi:MAG TPA: MgtC/SapB family protein [Pirellulaceae bacterium]|nr:MgtC/SapB family protein [Pirellulaceae bacterium]